MNRVNSISNKPSGRRPGNENTKAKIMSVAQTLFAEAGYDRVSMRQIATLAHVDAALIVHYFGTKQKLFTEAMLPLLEGPKRLPSAMPGDRQTIGMRLATLFVGIITAPESQRLMLGVFRSASAEAQAAIMLREVVQKTIIDQIEDCMPGPHKKLQATILGSQLIGVFVARYIVKIEPIASADPDELIAYLAPRLQAHFD